MLSWPVSRSLELLHFLGNLQACFLWKRAFPANISNAALYKKLWVGVYLFGGWRVYFHIFGNVVKCFKVFPTISKYLKIKPNIAIVLNIANYIFQTMAKYLKILSGVLEYFKIFLRSSGVCCRLAINIIGGHEPLH